MTSYFVDQLAAVLHDKMTECRYERPLESFDLGVMPAPWFEVDVLSKGRAALEEVNSKLGEFMQHCLKNICICVEEFSNFPHFL